MNEKFSIKEDRVGEKKGSPERYIDHVGKKRNQKEESKR